MSRFSTLLHRLKKKSRYHIGQEQLFPGSLAAHFSYHKCMTSYYNFVMIALSEEFGFYRKHFRSNYEQFEVAAKTIPGKKALSVNNRSDINWEELPPSTRGSHFVRDPRDLIISGYHYHLWSDERHINVRDYNWRPIVDDPLFTEYVASGSERQPTGLTFQEYLNSLDKEKGLILELIWRKDHFGHMARWDYQNPKVIEVKYEEIISNEAAIFRRIFEHYEFHPLLIERGVEIAEELSLANKKKRQRSHVRSGATQQWKSEFSSLMKDLFRDRYGQLLIDLGYEAGRD